MTTPQPAALPELPDAAVLAAARELCKIHAGQCGVDYDDTWAIYSEQFKADARACLEAAASATLQSQPAAAGVSDAEIRRAWYDCGVGKDFDVPPSEDDMRFARAILALRPQPVPMTREQI